jgi:ketosteroid isomerase-like protein
MQPRRLLIVIMSVFVAVWVLVASAPAGQEAAKGAQPREPETLAEQWSASLEAGRVELMKPLLADGFVYVNPHGEAIDGVTLLRLLKDRVLKFKVSPEGRKLRMHKDALVVTGTCHLTGEMNGKKVDGDYRYLNVFERQGERWVAIASSLTRVEGSGEAAKPAAPRG